MADKKTVELLVSGGQANAGPPLGPALGPLGVNVMMIVNKINELTKDYAGMKVPVKVVVDPDTKGFEVTVGTPTTSALIVSELKLEKGSATPHSAKVGNLTIDQVVRIAKMKRPELLAKDLKGAAKEILGACVSIGVTAEGKDPREVQKEIDEGKHDGIFSQG
ncbi:50S ribosomal protein L11 [Candidatus Bathyarchaeota archaeon]|nr:50S ribosomal protein L11 [Candidatus Bathyarchaeota archaeon]